MQTFTEENYLKAIFHLSAENPVVTTNQIACVLNTKAASVTDMIKRLSEKQLVNYTRYQGVSLTSGGEKVALNIVRKHRLWEYFLVEKLNFKWDEVHDMAEELEHISSVELIDRLDEFMEYPEYDPHGDPIPNKHGELKPSRLRSVLTLEVGDQGVISGVANHSTAFLQYLEKLKLTLGKRISILEVFTYDSSVELEVDGTKLNISREVAKNLLVG
jgi:DtxR family Mn-dependent transcriptional regulator